MPDPSPTTRYLVKSKAITTDEVEAAVDAVLAKPDTGLHTIGNGYHLDLAAVVKANLPAAAALADPDRKESFKRKMIRTAFLLARPVKV